MTKNLYTFTPEHRAQLEPWSKKWIANAMSTKPMDDEDRAAMRIAVKGLYEAANLTPPEPNKIIFVPSPFVLRFASGFASALIYLKNNKGSAIDSVTSPAIAAATHAATDAATHAATDAATATYAATYAATATATHAATDTATDAATAAATYAATATATDAATATATHAATHAATDAATHAATDAATHAATATATYAATYAATATATDAATDAATAAANDHDRYYNLNIDLMIKLAKEFGIKEFGLSCAQKVYINMWQGGNQWSGRTSFLSFFRHIAKLKIDYSKWDHWEKASIHAGPRVMHKDFCMISDRPEILLVDEQNRPHCETGPFCKWRDGTGIYALHGVYVPMWAIETPKDKIDTKRVLSLTNTEQRTALINYIGKAKFLEALRAELINEGKDGYKLYYLNVEGHKIGPYLFMRCPSTGREFLEGVGDADKYEFIDPTIKTCEDALKWRLEKARGENNYEVLGHQGDVCIFNCDKIAKVIDINSIKIRA